MRMERPGYLKRTQETRIDAKRSNVLTASPKTVTGQRSNQYCYRSLRLGVISNVFVEDMETSGVAIHKRGRGLDCCSRISGIGRFPCHSLLIGLSSKPAYVLDIDFGDLGRRKSSARLTGNYSEEDLVVRQILAVVGFPAQLIAGITSEVLYLRQFRRQLPPY